MPYLLERHKVEDYERWREVFDADAANREASGSKGAWIFRDAEDPTELVVLFEWDDLDRLRRRVGSNELREKMRDAGVRGDTKFFFLEEVGRVPV